MTGYLEEIRKMMYVCGDIVQPSTESAGLVEAVTHQQIVQMAEKAMESARQRSDLGSEVTLTVEDIFFLMRRSKEKVRRVLYQIDFKTQARRASATRQEEGDSVEGGRREEGGGSRSVVEREFVVDMFGCDFYTSEEAAQEQQGRLEHHDSRTRGMEPNEYLHYGQCRQVSFVKNLARFRKWLDLEPALDGHTPAHDVIEILGYLAYDTVRELVELSLLVKQGMEKTRHSISPLLLPSSSSHPPSLTPHSSHWSHDQQPLMSPGQGTETVGEATLSTATTRASRSRKRKSVSGDGPADPHPPDESGQVQSQNGLGTGNGGRGIQSSHIREALRRLSVPSGPLLPLATHHHRPSYTQKTLCL
jgi:transcription initiation protein SPT3